MLAEPLTGKIVFHTVWSGELIVDVSSSDGVMLMDFPADSFPPAQAQAINEELAAAIGLSKSEIVDIKASKDNKYLAIEVDQSVDIESLKVETFALVTYY